MDPLGITTKPMQGGTHPTTPPSGRLPRLLAAFSVYVILAVALPGAALAQGGGGTQTGTGASTVRPSDPDAVSPADIVSNYRKRFPYAKSSGEKDQVNSSQSGSGNNKSYKAYTRVRRKCTDKLGTMDDQPCDTDGAPVYCAEECVPDECPPAGKHCPVSPHYNWAQDQEQASVTPPSRRDNDAMETGLIPTKGLPMSDTMYQIIDRENKQRLLELMFDPERWMWKETAVGHMQMASTANSLGGAAEASFNSAVGTIRTMLINVANERSTIGSSGVGGSGDGKIQAAVAVVQRMYREIFLPMALLLLLPGALLTQVKGMVTRTIMGGADEDSINPFTGILRALIAIFLIPSTQLIVSYCIDIGNMLAYEVAKPEYGWVRDEVLSKWAKEQTFNPNPTNVNNGILPPGQGRTASEGNQQGPQSGAPTQTGASGGAGTGAGTGTGAGAGTGSSGGSQQSASDGAFSFGIPLGGSGGSGFFINIGSLFGAPSTGNPAVDAFNAFLNFLFGQQFQQAAEDAQDAGEGKAAGQLEGQVIQEDQLWLSGVMQVGFNGASMFMGAALNILTGYQLVFMCYLFLMGPIAASFFAWPSGIGQHLFKKVFSNWLNAVVVLSLWRFWWCVILAVMTQRILYLNPNPGSPSEMMVYNCFLALLLYIPFQPFDFNPGPMVTQVLAKAGGGGGGGSGGGGGAHGAPADVTDTSTSGGTRAGGTRRTPESGREMAAISSGSRGGGVPSGARAGGDGRAAPLTFQPPPAGAPGAQGARPRAGSGPPAGSPPPGGVTSVAGQSVMSSPPPGGSGSAPAGPSARTANPALSTVSSNFPNLNVGAISPGSPPTVPLTPSVDGPAVLLNTANPNLASSGMQALQGAAPSPSYLKDGSTYAGGAGIPGAGLAAPSVRAVSGSGGGGSGGAGGDRGGSAGGVSAASLAPRGGSGSGRGILAAFPLQSGISPSEDRSRSAAGEPQTPLSQPLPETERPSWPESPPGVTPPPPENPGG